MEDRRTPVNLWEMLVEEFKQTDKDQQNLRTNRETGP